MKKRALLVLIGLTLILILAFSPVGAAKPQATLPGGVGAGPLWHWRFQTGTTASNTSYWLSEELVKNILISTGGRLYFDLLPTGALFTSFESLDGTETGAVEMTTS